MIKPSPSHYRIPLNNAWDRVEQIDHDLGAGAYATYNKTLRVWALFYGVPFEAVVDAFVALSPNNDYHGNLRSLSAVLWAYRTGQYIGLKADTDPNRVTISTYVSCGKRAMSYVDGSVSFFDTVKGNKIRAFRDNIVHVEASSKVTIDGHMINILTDQNLTMREANLELRKHRYAYMEEAVWRLSQEIDLAPCVVQSVLWTSRKRLAGNNFSEQRDLFRQENKWEAILDPMDYPPFQFKEWLKWTKSKR